MILGGDCIIALCYSRLKLPHFCVGLKDNYILYFAGCVIIMSPFQGLDLALAFIYYNVTPSWLLQRLVAIIMSPFQGLDLALAFIYYNVTPSGFLQRLALKTLTQTVFILYGHPIDLPKNLPSKQHIKKQVQER